MEEHEVKTVLVDERATFENVKVNYALYLLHTTKMTIYQTALNMRTPLLIPTISAG